MDDVKPPDSLVNEGLIRAMCELAESAPPGIFVEVGVYKGGTAWHLAKIARATGRELHLFDTFSGMPCALPEDNHRIGDFADADVEDVMALIPDAFYHVGKFPDTLNEFLQNIALVHADCDQYESVRAVIDRLGPRMVPGGLMFFDDYHCTWGCTKAVDESFPVVERTSYTRAYVRF